MGAPKSPTAGQSLFTPISHPVLKKPGQRNMRSFARDRENCLLKIDDAKLTGSAAQPISIASSIDRDLLQSLVDLDEFPGIEEVKNLTDEIVEKWLSEQIAEDFDSLTKDALEEAAQKNVRMSMHEPDPKLRVKALFTDYAPFLRSRNWGELIKKNPKMAIDQACDLLKPAELREKVGSDLQLGKFDIRKKWKPFCKHVMQRAITCDEYMPIKSQKNKNGDQKRSKPKKGKGSRSDDHEDNTSDDADKKSAEGNSSQNKEGQQLPERLSPERDELHFLKHCKNASKELKKKLFEEFRRNKKKPAGSLKAMNANPAGGRCDGLLMDKAPAIINGDCGADHSALCEKHLQERANASIFALTLPLAKPAAMSLAISGSQQGPLAFKAHKKARLSIAINARAGPLRLRSIELLALEENMPEALISRPALKAMGFDLDAHLASARDSLNEKDFSCIGFYAAPKNAESNQPRKQPSSLPRMLIERSANPTPSSSMQGETDPIKASPIFYGDGPDDDPLRSDDEPLSGQGAAEIAIERLKERREEAIKNGLPRDMHEQLGGMMQERSDLFRIKLGADPPADAPPMKMRLKEGAKPVRAKARRCSPPQRAFMRKKADELQSLGAACKSNQSQWASPPLIAPKAGPEELRFTVDLRAANEQTAPFTWPMPHLESAAHELADAACCAAIDLCHGHWQMPLHEESRECQSFIAPDGALTPARALRGQASATFCFQSAIGDLRAPLRDNSLQWLDDMLMRAETPGKLMKLLEKFFIICRDHGIKTHAAKCKFFLAEAKWRGRLISKEGVKMDPRRMQGLLDMEEPKAGADLQQLACAANWMRMTTPEFSKLISPLKDLLEVALSKAGKRAKNAAKKMLLSGIGWSQKRSQSFSEVKSALKRAATLAHPDPKKLLCLLTDASEHHWPGALTQIPAADQDLQLDAQHHQSLAFLSGSFMDSSLRWPTPEKEAFAIAESATRLDHMLLRPEGFRLFADHKSLVFIFDPTKAFPNLARHARSKAQRWSLKLSAFRCSITRVAGEDSAWAGLLSRWGAPITAELKNLTAGKICALSASPISPERDPDFTWPNICDIVNAQKEAAEEGAMPESITMQGEAHARDSGAVWMPHTANGLQLRVCAVGHCGRSGRRGIDTAIRGIEERFCWNSMKADIAAFCSAYLHCQATTGGKRMPRPLSHALRADKPSELMHFDFLRMGQAPRGDTYALIIKDDASSFVWLEPCKAADASATAEALMKWLSLFGAAKAWASGRGPHFKSAIMSELSRKLHSRHRFTAPCSPQSSGAAEAACKEALRACRALLSELKLTPQEWATAAPIMQSILSHSLRPTLGQRAPIAAFTGLTPGSPLRALTPPAAPKAQSIDFIKAQKIASIEKLIEALGEMRRGISKRRAKKRESAVKHHSKKTRAQEVNFEGGDFALAAKKGKWAGRKLQVAWKGPKRVTRAISGLARECEGLAAGKTNSLHASRLKQCADSRLSVTEELLDAAQRNGPPLEAVEKMLHLRCNPALERREAQIKWSGFDHELPTWEPCAITQEDAPEMLAKLLAKRHDQELALAAKNSSPA